MRILPRIDITQNLGRLSVRSERAVLEADVDQTELKMNRTDLAVKMDVELPRVEIDQTGSFASSGLKKPIPQYQEFIDKCKQEGISAIGRIAGEGREFLEIQRSDSVIQEQSRRIGQEYLSLTVVAMPSVRPEINAVPGSIEFDVQLGDAGVRWDRSEKSGRYVPAQTQITWLEKPNIDISVAGGIDALV